MERVYMKKCIECEETKLTDKFPPINSPFVTKAGSSPVCLSCLNKQVDLLDFESVDRYCRWANIPFIPNEWVKTYDDYGPDSLQQYSVLMRKGEYIKTDWEEFNDLWKQKLNAGTMMEEIAELKSNYMHKMRLDWKMSEGTFEKFLSLENYYNNMISSRVIRTEAEKDVLRKVCKIAYAADEAIEIGDPKAIKELTKVYMDMLKQADLLDHESARKNEIDSVGRLFEFMEKSGWMPEFYDETEKDIVDETIQDIQKTNRRLILGDESISDTVEAKMRKAKLNVEDALTKDIRETKKETDILKEMAEKKKKKGLNYVKQKDMVDFND